MLYFILFTGDKIIRFYPTAFSMPVSDDTAMFFPKCKQLKLKKNLLHFSQAKAFYVKSLKVSLTIFRQKLFCNPSDNLPTIFTKSTQLKKQRDV